MNPTLPADCLMLARGQALSTLVDPQAPMWQVEQGMLLVKGAQAPGEAAWHLALPGDWLNLPRACGLDEGTQATALLPSRLRTVPQVDRLSRESLLGRLVAQQQRWSMHLMALRSGPVERRIRHLLTLIRLATGGARQGASVAMPVLRDMATLVDAVPETVCRVLVRLQPRQRERAPRSPQPALA
ncbi:hypothetical protein LPB72_21590 [Hydrogenophaga crassostreae]|nr:hypothetical protein [Hydrogenophaga crassostreae]OAD39205.1 hypothetical protein LPB72_21590 [Hydrogenophaga crassostreae]